MMINHLVLFDSGAERALGLVLEREWYLKHPQGYAEKLAIIQAYGGVALSPRLILPRRAISAYQGGRCQPRAEVVE